jgi:hypothetical protein
MCIMPRTAACGQMANIEFVHSYIQQKHGITVPTSEPNIKKAVNVRYVLCAVDVANRILNGSATTDYCNHSLAAETTVGGVTGNPAADTVTVINAVDGLIALIDTSVNTTPIFTSNTTYTVPAGFTKIDVFAVGGGGGGSGDCNKCGGSGRGGAGGAVVYTTITVSPGQNIPVTIGAGGAGGAGHSCIGNAGGATTFGSVTAAGGAGGAGHSEGCNFNGAAGADGVSCPISIPETSGKLFGAGGGEGSDAYCCVAAGGATIAPGGNTGGGKGGGGANNTSSNAGGNGTFYGAGGGGAAFSSGHSTSTGGSGYQGVVIIRLHN